MMNTNKVSIQEIDNALFNLINFSSQEKPVEFADTFHSIMQDRLASAVSDKKIEISKTIFNKPNSEEPSNEKTE